MLVLQTVARIRRVFRSEEDDQGDLPRTEGVADGRAEGSAITGTTVTVKVAHVRLCHSRMLFVRAYPHETQEMVFDAHDRSFGFFRGACTRGISANMKSAVETIFVGRERAYNRRFLQMCSHYPVDPVACTPASGWGSGEPWPKAA